MTTHKSERLTLKEVVAMGVGGMIGGGIFSVLGLAIAEAGHAAPFTSTLAAWLTLMLYLWHTSRESLAWIGLGYLAVILAELLFSRRRLGTVKLADLKPSIQKDQKP